VKNSKKTGVEALMNSNEGYGKSVTLSHFSRQMNHQNIGHPL
jgi:hypothetical protein